MSEEAILWKLGFGAMVLAVSLLSLLNRTPPETVLEPVVVSPRTAQAPSPPPDPAPVPAMASLAPNEALVKDPEPAPAVRREPAPLASPPPSMPAAIVAVRPATQTPVAAHASFRRRPPMATTAVAVRAPRGAIIRTSARSRPSVRPHSPYVSGRLHYPFDPRHRWSGEQPP